MDEIDSAHGSAAVAGNWMSSSFHRFVPRKQDKILRRDKERLDKKMEEACQKQLKKECGTHVVRLRKHPV